MWNEAFRKLGKFDIDEKNFDRQEFLKREQEVERWEREKGDRMEGELDGEIEMQEVEKALSKAQKGKAAGDDGCINEILKRGGEGMKESLLVLFQKCGERREYL